VIEQLVAMPAAAPIASLLLFEKIIQAIKTTPNGRKMCGFNMQSQSDADREIGLARAVERGKSVQRPCKAVPVRRLSQVSTDDFEVGHKPSIIERPTLPDTQEEERTTAAIQLAGRGIRTEEPGVVPKVDSA
jgi:hypothetical protein